MKQTYEEWLGTVNAKLQEKGFHKASTGEAKYYFSRRYGSYYAAELIIGSRKGLAEDR